MHEVLTNLSHVLLHVLFFPLFAVASSGTQDQLNGFLITVMTYRRTPGQMTSSSKASTYTGINNIKRSKRNILAPSRIRTREPVYKRSRSERPLHQHYFTYWVDLLLESPCIRQIFFWRRGKLTYTSSKQMFSLFEVNVSSLFPSHDLWHNYVT
jgi:hypothetical protein